MKSSKKAADSIRSFASSNIAITSVGVSYIEGLIEKDFFETHFAGRKTPKELNTVLRWLHKDFE